MKVQNQITAKGSSDISIKVATLNVRSINVQSKLSSLIAAARQSAPDILIVTETWLQHKLAFKLRGTCLAQSPLNRSSGVLILTSKKFPQLQPIMPELWTINTIAAVVTHKDTQQQIVVVGHYSAPGQRTQLNTELKHLVQVIRTRMPSARLVIGGDFNRKA